MSRSSASLQRVLSRSGFRRSERQARLTIPRRTGLQGRCALPRVGSSGSSESPRPRSVRTRARQGCPWLSTPANFPGSSSQSPREVLGPGTSAEQGKCRPDARRGSSREGGQDSWVLWLIAVGACSLPLAPEESFPDPNQTLCETESRPGWLGRTGSGTGRAGVVACDPGGARGRPPRLPPPPPGWPGYAASCAWWPWASEVSLRLPCKRPKRL